MLAKPVASYPQVGKRQSTACGLNYGNGKSEARKRKLIDTVRKERTNTAREN